MANDSVFKNLIRKISVLIGSNHNNEIILEKICNLLKNNIPDYNWVGFYLVDKAVEKQLILGPYAGEPTEHIRINFGQGICGQTAETKETFIIDDVSRENNYLPCNLDVKSEIVIPIFRNGEFIGELDIDSHKRSTFTQKDEKFLQQIADLTANLI